MIKIRPIALSFSLLALSPLAALAQVADKPYTQTSIDPAKAMMNINASLLRNGDNIWQRIREGTQMTEVNSEIVRKHERAYAANPAGLRRSLDRSRKYMFYIMTEVERRGMPTEIALLPVVESAFIPGAKSHVGASGLWQFMPATGRHYGLEQTWWYDGRRDVVESTNAALDYLQNLYNMFGDWSLALASYNWGEGNVSKAIKRAQAAGLEPTYENLRMPNETRNYVPKLLAVRNALLSPEKYGLSINKLPNKPYFVAVAVDRHIDIDIAARLADMPVDEFKLLNPGYNLPVFAYKSGRKMLIPADHLAKFEQNMEKWGDKPLMTWQVYMPDNSRAITEVAGEFSMDADQLRTVNGLRGNTLNAGQPVLVAMNGKRSAPTINNDSDASVMIASASKPRQTPVTTVAETRITPVVIAKADPAPSSNVQITAAAKPTPKQSETVIFTAQSNAQQNTTSVMTAMAKESKPVVTTVASTTPAIQQAPSLQGTVFDTPPTIAMTDTDDIAHFADAESSDNKIVAAGLARVADTPVSTQVTAVTTTVKPVAASQSADASRAKPRVLAAVDPNAVQHTVQSGDTLYSIARRYSLTVAELKSLNNLNDDTARLGQILKIKDIPTSYVANSQSRDGLTKASDEYVVKKGDTAYSIARKLGVSHNDLNLPAGQNLMPGQRIKIQGL